MKKVLVISNLYHSSPRIPGFAKYLGAHGWEAILLTVPIVPGDRRFGAPPRDLREYVRILETARYRKARARVEDMVQVGSRRLRRTSRIVSRLARRLYSLYNEIFFFPDAERKWIPYAIAAAERLLRRESIDVMLSSSSPVTCHLIASRLKKHHRIPWVADFRDLWTQNHDYPYSQVRRAIERALERRTMRSADSFVTVAPPLAAQLTSLHGTKAVSLTNGYDPAGYGPAPPLTGKFTITYTGQIYLNKQDPLKILLALKELIAEGEIREEDVELRFFGPESKLVNYYVAQHAATGYVRQYGVCPIETAHLRQQESQVLVLFNWEQPRQRGIYTQKIFDYLGAGRPILATGGFRGDVREDLLRETNAGTYATDAAEIKEAVLDYYRQFRVRGKTTYAGNGNVARYGYPRLAGQLAEILEAAIRSNEQRSSTRRAG